MKWPRNTYTMLFLCGLIVSAVWLRFEQSKTVFLATANTASARSVPKVCGFKSAAPTHYTHIIWILEENRSLGQVMNAANAPFISDLASQCAYSTKFTDNEPRQAFGSGYHSVVHYIADLGGSNCITGNATTGTGCLAGNANNPLQASLPTGSLLQQLASAGLTWKSYQESAPSPCSLTNSGAYVARHDGVLYFSQLRSACQKNDIPIPTLRARPSGALISAISSNSLPTFSYITPNLYHDMHSGSIAAGDGWLKSYLLPIFRSRAYLDGKTAIFVVWDEATKSNADLPNLIIAPTVRSGPNSISMNGFTILRTTEDMLGLRRLGCASGTPPGDVGTCYSGASTNLRLALSI
jgi:hypothetical protein